MCRTHRRQTDAAHYPALCVTSKAWVTLLTSHMPSKHNTCTPAASCRGFRSRRSAWVAAFPSPASSTGLLTSALCIITPLSTLHAATTPIERRIAHLAVECAYDEGSVVDLQDSAFLPPLPVTRQPSLLILRANMGFPISIQRRTLFSATDRHYSGGENKVPSKLNKSCPAFSRPLEPSVQFI